VSARRALAALAASLVAIALVACGGSDAPQEERAGEGRDRDKPQVAIQTQNGFNPQRIYEEASHGVVTVRSVFRSGAAGPLGGGAGQGSGFVVNDEGEVVTNAHVVTDGEAGGAGRIREAQAVFVELGDRNQVEAEIVGVDPNADIALLRIEPGGLDLDPIELGDSDEVEVGEPVVAIGSPFGQDQSLSVGIVSATERSIESLTQFRIDGGIQTDASINPGNSGGPLLDAAGEVIGVNQQINTTSGANVGVGFAVPVNLVKRSIDDLRDEGTAEYAFIGVTTVPLYPQLADELGIDAPTGALITAVEPGSPAAEAGLRGTEDGEEIEFQGREVETGGDVIVAVEGEELVGETDLSRLIAEHKPGDEISVEILRNGSREEVDVTLQERPGDLEIGR
jgi:S1-C subfamily serine protease